MHFESVLEPLLLSFSSAFSRPTFETFRTLVHGAILAPGRRTITGILRASGEMATKHFSTYHRFLSNPCWNSWKLSWILMELVLLLVPTGVVRLIVDDTTCRRWGPKVFEKGCHRDAVRSTKSHTILCFGHKWVTLSVLVTLPFTKRPWALPIAALLYRKRSKDENDERRHRTLEDLAKILIYRTVRRFRDRTFEVIGDGGYGSNDFSNGCHQLGVELVARLRIDSVLYDKPKPRVKGQRGRPAKKGKRQPAFKDRVTQSKEDDWTYGEVAWYAGKKKAVRWLTGLGLRYKPKTTLPQIRWVVVQDVTTGHWECFFSTDITASPDYIIEGYVTRWALEVTYQEVREHLGLETSKNWCQNSVERTVPCLLGLFTLVTLCFEKICQTSTPQPRQSAWYHKADLTFSDAMLAVRKMLWTRLIFHDSPKSGGIMKIDKSRWEFLSERLSATG